MTLPNGYTMKTTFYTDFSIADQFGISAIKDTYSRAFKEWKDDYVYLTELTIVLNIKIFEYYGTNDVYARLYNDLWEEVDAYACENLKDEELDFFYRVTD